MRQWRWRVRFGGAGRWYGYREFRGWWKFCARDTAGLPRAGAARRRLARHPKPRSECRAGKERTKMSPPVAFLLDLALAAFLFAGFVAFLKQQLRPLLIQLFATPKRARSSSA